MDFESVAYLDITQRWIDFKCRSVKSQKIVSFKIQIVMKSRHKWFSINIECKSDVLSAVERYTLSWTVWK